MILTGSYNILNQVCFHSGRTDASGGHTDLLNRSGLGLYHYHHGEGPHLHPHNQTNNAEIWIDGYQTGVKFVGYLDSNESRVYTNQFEDILKAIGPCTSKVKKSTLEIMEPNIREPKMLSLKDGYVKVHDLLTATEDACGYYVSNTMTANNIFIVELKTDRIKSEILVGSQKVDAYLDTAEDRVYTKDFTLLASYLGGWMCSVIGTELEIIKAGMTYEESIKISLRGGFVKLADLLNNIENCCGYYVSNTKTVVDVFTVELEVDRLVIWLYGEELNGYIKGKEEYLLIQELEQFIYYIGSEKDYNLVSIHGGQLHILGDIQQAIPLPAYNLLKIRDLLTNAKGSVEYDIASSWFWKSRSVDYIAITTKWYIASSISIPTKLYLSDFGKIVDEKAPLNNDVIANVWYNGSWAGEFYHKNGSTYCKNAINIENYPYLCYYLENYTTLEDAINAYAHQEFTSHWYDKRENTYNIIINTQMNTAPIRMVRVGNQVTINANFKFLGTLGNELFEGRNETYGDVAIDAIKKCWEGRYYEQYSSNENIWYDNLGLIT